VKTCAREVPGLDAPRSHPWTDAVADAASRYYDFKAHPDLVRTSLEDFTPWNGHAAVESFYRLIEQLNAPGGRFESNDCEFTGPRDNPDPGFEKRLECSGRLMILFRDLSLNLSRSRALRLENDLQRRLAEVDPDFAWGMFGTTIMRTRYLGLPGSEDDQLGYQLMLSFWAWGDTVDEAMENFHRLVGNLAQMLGAPTGLSGIPAS
jgi:hypothetical protein